MKTIKICILCLAIALIFLVGCEQMPVQEQEAGDSSLADIKEKGKLVVGSDIPYGIMEFYDDSGKAVGIDMDLANEIASQIGVEMEVKTMPFNDLFDAVKSGEVDIIASAVTITEERQKEMLKERKT